MGKPKQWLPPSPILGAKHMINEILGSLFCEPTLQTAIETAGGVVIETAGGEPIEKAGT